MKTTTTLPYYVLDVFTTESYLGNPLAVVFTEGDLLLPEYENMAREFGYSETSFVHFTGNQLQVRSFTSTGVEVGGGGHNLLGAVSAALYKGTLVWKEENTPCIVRIMGEPFPVFIQNNGCLPVVKMQQKPATIGDALPVGSLAAALQVQEDKLVHAVVSPTIVQTEVAHAMIPVADLETLNSIRPNNAMLIELSKQWGFEGYYCFVLPEAGCTIIAEARFFNPLIGIEEDAATGTAAGPLAGFLYHHHLIQANQSYLILQGTQLRQPSLLEVMVTDNHVYVGGASVVTMQGTLIR